MEKKVIHTKDHEYTFINTAYSTHNGFAHHTVLFEDDSPYEIAQNTIHYLNRTWESYTYQTVMTGCVNYLLDVREKYLINTFKAQNNISRLTKKYHEKIQDILNNDSTYQDLFELKKALK